MLTTLLFPVAVAVAGEWSSQEPDPKVLTDVTAYTVGKKHLEIGLFRQDYGLLHNVHIGTRLPYFFLGAANAHAKVTAIQTPKLDASLQAEWLYRDLSDLGVPGGRIVLTPIQWTGSWIVSKRISLHFGTGWTIASVEGAVTAGQIGEALGASVGADISADLTALGSAGELYAGANLTLYDTDLAVEYRLNRRDTLLLTWRQYAWVSALVAGGVAVDADGVEVEVGPSAKLRAPLKDSLPALVALSWQLSYEHLHVRFGIPLPVTGPGAVFALPQAFALYWDLGPKDSP